MRPDWGCCGGLDYWEGGYSRKCSKCGKELVGGSVTLKGKLYCWECAFDKDKPNFVDWSTEQKKLEEERNANNKNIS